MNYNKRPKLLDSFELEVKEYFSYTYLPVKLAGQYLLTYEDRLKPFAPLLGRASCDFIGDFGLDRYVDSYVYLTAKHAWQRPDKGFNRQGWHSDGFMSEDISYIWSNRQPTIFNNGDFYLTQDDEKSMLEMQEQADNGNNYTLPNGSLIRMDQYSIHKVGPIEEGERVFAKIVISKDKFDLRGNSHNYLLDYDWPMRPRQKKRNIPQAL